MQKYHLSFCPLSFVWLLWSISLFYVKGFGTGSILYYLVICPDMLWIQFFDDKKRAIFTVSPVIDDCPESHKQGRRHGILNRAAKWQRFPFWCRCFNIRWSFFVWKNSEIKKLHWCIFFIGGACVPFFAMFSNIRLFSLTNSFFLAEKRNFFRM